MLLRQSIEMELQFWRDMQELQEQELYYIIKLGNARICEIQQETSTDFSEDGAILFLERVSFVYNTILWKDAISGFEHQEERDTRLI